MGGISSYDADFYAWTNEQAALLRAGRLATADIENIAEELESMGRSEKRELISRLTVLLAHLLKWQFQPQRQGASWEATITVQRDELGRHLSDNPSLKARLDEAVEDAYKTARTMARGETGFPKSIFPTTCPWTPAQVMDEEFWPES